MSYDLADEFRGNGRSAAHYQPQVTIVMLVDRGIAEKHVPHCGNELDYGYLRLVMSGGATLVPLLTLGIPGDVITAVMLGAFMIFDLQPGPLLFMQHIDLIFGLFCALIMCDVALRLVGMGFIRYARRVATSIPTSMIFPAIVVLCIFGSYAINNSVFDVLTMVAFGMLGYVMAMFEIASIPFLIAFVLAPMLERGLRRSLTLSGGDPLIFFQRPIAIGFFVLTVIAIISLTRGAGKKMR